MRVAGQLDVQLQRADESVDQSVNETKNIDVSASAFCFLHVSVCSRKQAKQLLYGFYGSIIDLYVSSATLFSGASRK
jgi:hypothetical protein